MITELEVSLQNRTGRRNDKSSRGHEKALCLVTFPMNKPLFYENIYHIFVNIVTVVNNEWAK